MPTRSATAKKPTPSADGERGDDPDDPVELHGQRARRPSPDRVRRAMPARRVGSPVAVTSPRPSPSTTKVPAKAGRSRLDDLGHALAGQRGRVDPQPVCLQQTGDRPRSGHPHRAPRGRLPRARRRRHRHGCRRAPRSHGGAAGRAAVRPPCRPGVPVRTRTRRSRPPRPRWPPPTGAARPTRRGQPPPTASPRRSARTAPPAASTTERPEGWEGGSGRHRRVELGPPTSSDRRG